MHHLLRCGIIVLALAVLAVVGRAQTFNLTDGTVLIGEPVSFDERGAVIRLTDGSYSERTPWIKFSQDDLKTLAGNPKARDYAEPFIEITDEERAKKIEITIRDVPRLDRPAQGSLLGALAGSSVGLVALLLLYAANLYAAYEVSVIRMYPAGLVCGLAAVVPVIAPVVFLCMPSKLRTMKDEQADMIERRRVEEAAVAQAKAEDRAEQAAVAEQAARDAGPALPPTQIFKRGEFVFNRRFFETKFSGFFGVVRRESDKDMVLTIRAARGENVVQRITRIAPNEMHVQVQKGPASEEVIIPFVEVQEVVLKHKNA